MRRDSDEIEVKSIMKRLQYGKPNKWANNRIPLQIFEVQVDSEYEYFPSELCKVSYTHNPYIKMAFCQKISYSSYHSSLGNIIY